MPLILIPNRIQTTTANSKPAGVISSRSLNLKWCRKQCTRPSSLVLFLMVTTWCSVKFSLEPLKEGQRTNLINELETEARSLPPDTLPLLRPIQLLRVPKASSSSFSAFLRLQYNCTSKEHPPGDCTRGNERVCPAIHKCSNHYPPPPLDTSHPPLVTFVRDPIRRYLSAYTYPGHHGKGTADILEHLRLFPEWNNTMTNFFAGHSIGTWGPVGRPNRGPKLSNNPRTAPPDESTLPTQEIWEKRLDAALRLFQDGHVVFAGIAEYFDDSVKVFCRIYHCPALQESLNSPRARQNSGSAAATTNFEEDSEQQRALEQAHQYDYRVYEAATHHFCTLLHQFRSDTAFVATLSTEVLSFCNAKWGSYD